MKPHTSYKLGEAFPHEGFVQRAAEAYFQQQGYEVTLGKRPFRRRPDLCCTHPTTHTRWIVQAKGETKNTGLDLCTGIGQLLLEMSDEATFHAIAVPAKEFFLERCRGIPSWVRNSLRFYWLFVHADKTIRQVAPHQYP